MRKLYQQLLRRDPETDEVAREKDLFRKDGWDAVVDALLRSPGGAPSTEATRETPHETKQGSHSFQNGPAVRRCMTALRGSTALGPPLMFGDGNRVRCV